MQPREGNVMILMRKFMNSESFRRTFAIAGKDQYEDFLKALVYNHEASAQSKRNDRLRNTVEALHLSLELADSQVEGPEDPLRKYGKVKDSIRRDILVPATMTLQQLHEVIQRLFGWENSHERMFELPTQVHESLLHDEFSRWNKLCGVYFSFNLEDTDRYLWDEFDDEEEEEPLFTSGIDDIFISRYSKTYDSEDYLDMQAGFVDYAQYKNPFISDKILDFSSLRDERGPQAKTSISSYLDLCENLYYQYPNELLERLFLIDLLLLPGQPPLQTLFSEAEWQNLASLQELALKSVIKLDIIVNEIIGSERWSDDEVIDFVVDLVNTFEEQQLQGADSECNFQQLLQNLKTVIDLIEPKPLTDNLLYTYDFGDNWQVQIRMVEAYYPAESFHAQADESVGFAGLLHTIPYVVEFVDSKGKQAKADLSELLAKVCSKAAPVCIDRDGLSVLDDIGGIYGFREMLRTLHESKDKDEVREIREWARSQGWTGRLRAPKNML